MMHVALGGAPWFGVGYVLATIIGVEAVYAAGGARSAAGLLNLALLAKYVLIGLFLKLLVLEPWDDRLLVPGPSVVVLLCGFSAVFLAAKFTAALKFQSTQPWARLALSPAAHLKIGYGLSVVGFTATFIALSTTAFRGPLLPFGAILPAALAHIAYYTIESRHRTRWLHLGVMFSLQFLLGFAGASKEGMLTPIVVVALIYLLRHGMAKLWLIAGAGAVLVVSLVFLYPYSQYMKSETAGFSWDTAKTLLIDAGQREQVRAVSFTHIESAGMNYLGRDAGMLERFMLLKTMDRFVMATDATGQTGWYAIWRGLGNFLPRVLNPSKEDFRPGNFYGQVSGLIGLEDDTTSIAPTVFGGLYNSFGVVGVLAGGFVLYSLANIAILVVGGRPKTADPRSVAIVMLLQHALGEASVTDSIYALFTVAAYGLCMQFFFRIGFAPFADESATPAGNHRDPGGPARSGPAGMRRPRDWRRTAN